MPTIEPTTAAWRDVNRLTDDDRRAIARRIADTTDAWPRGYRPTWSDAETVERTAHHAIGCTAYDLRPSELAEIARAVRVALGLVRPTEPDPDAMPAPYRGPFAGPEE